MSLTLSGVRFGYPGTTRPILDGVDLHVRPGEVVALMAPSGSGKSTLLAIAGLLLAPDAGTITIGGTARTTADADAVLGTDIAWILQGVSLLPRRSLLDNVALPLLARGHTRADAHTLAAAAIAAVGITFDPSRQARSVSGGEAQRVGVARALITRPAVILADEPTANLDAVTAVAVARDIFRSVTGAAVVVATHDSRIAAMTDRTLILTEGRLTEGRSSDGHLMEGTHVATR